MLWARVDAVKARDAAGPGSHTSSCPDLIEFQVHEEEGSALCLMASLKTPIM